MDGEAFAGYDVYLQIKKSISPVSFIFYSCIFEPKMDVVREKYSI
jgi:hypothetical protein